VTDQDGALEGEGETLGEPACPAFQRLRIRRARLPHVGLQTLDEGVVAAVAASRAVELGRQRLQRRGLPAHGAEDVEALHVARAFPDRVERGVPIEPRQGRVLDVAVAGQALQRLGDGRDGAPGDPVLDDRCRDPREEPRALLAGRVVEAAGEAHHERGRGLGFQTQIGEDVPHQRLVEEASAERGAMAGVMGRLGDRAAERAGRRDPAGALPVERFPQGRVEREEVVVLEGRRLVQDLVRSDKGAGAGGHGHLLAGRARRRGPGHGSR
jgi:hypothetical protein